MFPSDSHFVPASLMGSSKDTAILLVGTAREFGVSQQEIQKVRGGGFLISHNLRDVLYAEGVIEQQTSGNRAEEKNSEKEQQ